MAKYTYEQVQARLQQAEAAGDTAAADRLRAYLASMPATSLRRTRAAPSEAPVEGDEGPQLGDFSPRELTELKEYMQHANAIGKVGRAVADYTKLLQRLDSAKSQPGAPGHEGFWQTGRLGAPPREDIPGVGGATNAVGGALENVREAPIVGGIIGPVAHPLGQWMRNTTDAGREARQRSKELELLGANMLVKGTGQISDYERKMVKDAWGLDPTDLYADRNIRIGLKKAAADAMQQMNDLDRTYPGAAAYAKRQGVSTASLQDTFAGLYDPTTVLGEE